MQPGSGSWDGIFWGYYSNGEFLLLDLTVITNILLRLNGNNSRFENSIKGYNFGNELIGIIGWNYSIGSSLDLALLLKYRNTANDVFNDQNIPNTGGNWIYLKPGINLYLTNNLTSRIESELPIFRSVNGTQLTTMFATSISFFYSINIKGGSF